MNRSLSLHAWLQAHLDVARDSFGRLRRNGLGSLLSVIMMGCALALPTSLKVLTDNAAAASEDWQRQFSVSLYLSDSISEDQGKSLLKSLLKDATMERGEYLSPAQALAEFREFSGFGKALDLLDDNPLPAVIILWPKAGLDAPTLEAWLARQDARPEITMAQADSGWLERLQALLDFGASLTQIMGLVLGLTVVLIVANTIRLEIESRREEILVMKLIGAPDGFIQRPFLYSGTLYGLLSGLVACLSVTLILQALDEHLGQLAASYGQPLSLQGLSVREILWLVGGASAMGWLGAFHSVWRHLSDIEPE